jgi:hypothetical protein
MQFVKYIGLSHRRVITADDWQSVGISDQGSVEWSAINNFSVPVDRFSEEALRTAIEPDDAFVIVGGDQHAPRYVGRSMTPEEAASVPVDMMGAVGASRVPAWLSGRSEP